MIRSLFFLKMCCILYEMNEWWWLQTHFLLFNLIHLFCIYFWSLMNMCSLNNILPTDPWSVMCCWSLYSIWCHWHFLMKTISLKTMHLYITRTDLSSHSNPLQCFLIVFDTLGIVKNKMTSAETCELVQFIRLVPLLVCSVLENEFCLLENTKDKMRCRLENLVTRLTSSGLLCH